VPSVKAQGPHVLNQFLPLIRIRWRTVLVGACKRVGKAGLYGRILRQRRLRPCVAEFYRVAALRRWPALVPLIRSILSKTASFIGYTSEPLMISSILGALGSNPEHGHSGLSYSTKDQPNYIYLILVLAEMDRGELVGVARDKAG